jgi:leucyl-tRNA---protein transferase
MSAPLPPDLTFYSTPPHPCSYLEDRQATILFADPRYPMTSHLYRQLIDLGFRRSGNYVYRPRCHGCDACQSVRIPVSRFRPNRSQRRSWNSNRDITSEMTAPRFDEEHYALYLRYQIARHDESDGEGNSREQYQKFLLSAWSNGMLVEFRLDGQLLMVAIVDQLENGLSAVYTFFDPDHSRRSLGTLAILWQLTHAERLNLPYLYLGYYVEGCQRMRYKKSYRPLEYQAYQRWWRID